MRDITFTQFVIVSLACVQALEIWRHGKIFVELRAWLSCEPFGSSITTLLLCTFCLSPWVGFAAAIWLDADTMLTDADGMLTWLLASALRIFVLGLAIARLSNLINDLTHGYCRTPRDHQKIE